VVGDSYGQTFGADTFFSKYLLGFDQSIFERIGQAFSTEPRHGSDIRLTIDAKLSDHAYHALGEHKGAVVVMDYSTGEILCSVSSPDFDPKYMQEYLNGERELDDSAMVDRVTSGQYTPGSVFKIVTLTAALRYLPGIEERVFDCCGPLAFDPESGEYLEEVKITPEQDAAFREEAEGDTAGLSGEYSVVRDYNGEYHGELTLKEAFMKMKLMGVDTVVLGSGKSRSIPDEISRQEGIYKLKEFFKRCNEFAQKSDITVAIEPLNVDETNVIHTVSDGAELVRDIDCSHMKLLADVYHMYRSDEDMKVLSENKDILRHIHVCHAEKRAAVKDFSSEYLKMFAKALDEMNYQGRVSLECQFDNFEEECKNSYAILRELF